ncbi:MAG TPA: metallophosphoesterase [Stellaceae bacterium]|nr:metallophosphoesterase [Stellaceae bacterium]
MRVALVTDSHLAPMPAAEAFNANWRAVRDFIARSEADLTIHLGDITVDGATEQSHYTHALSLSEDWPTPIRFLPGNHDIGDNPPGPGMAGDHLLDLARLAAFRDTFGPDYWTQDAGGWWLIALNAQLFGADARAEEEQWEWLRRRVNEADARPVLLLLHKPLCHRDAADARPHGRYVPFAQRQRLLSILKAVDLRLVLSGHAH